MKLSLKGTIVVANTRTPTQEELETFTRVTLYSSHTWDPHSVKFPTPHCTVEEELSIQGDRRTMSSVAVERIEDCMTSSKEYEETVLYSINKIQQRMIAIFRVSSLQSQEKTIF